MADAALLRLLRTAQSEKQRTFEIVEAAKRRLAEAITALDDAIQHKKDLEREAKARYIDVVRCSSLLHSPKPQPKKPPKRQMKIASSPVAHVERGRGAEDSGERRRPREQLTKAQQAYNLAQAAVRQAIRLVFEAGLAYKQTKRECELADEEYARAKKAYQEIVVVFAGVPAKYHQQVQIDSDAKGAIDIFFGGQRAPSGPGHGHYVIEADGRIIYRRDPNTARGPHNFVDPSEG